MSYVDINVADGQTMKAHWVPAKVDNPNQAPGIVLIQKFLVLTMPCKT